MPGINGLTCLEQLRRLDPDVKVLVITGYVREGARQALRGDGGVEILQKPFFSGEPSRAVARTLAGKTEAGRPG